ncbi:uncharacterized protein ACRADG_006769 [Cochliomyia hominivorax]
MGKLLLSELLTIICLINLLVLLTGISPMVPGAGKTWTYELKSITSKSSDTEKIQINLEIERVSRGVYAVSGEIKIFFDITEGDTNYITAKSFRSAQGDNDYKVLPFQMPSTHFLNVLNTHYKDILMDTLKDCSDCPVFEKEFVPPLEKKVYTLNACQFSQDGLPNHLQDGFYRLLIIGTGDVEYEIEVIAEITTDL